MEKLVKHLSNNIGASLSLDEEKTKVIEYGMFALIQMIAICATVLVLGAFIGCMLQCFLVILTVGILRRSTGGSHANTSFGCYIVSCLVTLIVAFASNYLSLNISQNIWLYVTQLIAIIISSILIYKLAPVDSPNKKITSKDKIKRLRRNSLTTMILFILIISLVQLIFKNQLSISIGLSISFAILWQSLTLIKFKKD